jgi:AbrB family looped-hinge helix DNA binding protein
MRQSIATVTRKGQVTIPAEIRRALGLEPKGKVAFIMEENEVKLRPAKSALRAGFGAVKPHAKPENFVELRRKAQEWAGYQAQEEL